MNIPSHQELASGLLPAVLEAARIELSYFRGDFAVQRKADSSPVTVADQEAEVVVLAALDRIAPQVPVIAEEQYSDGVAPEVDGTLFLVDALDGTKAFVRGNIDFTINIALIAEQMPIFGIILLPATGDLYVTTGPMAAGHAVIDVEADVRFENIDVRPIHTRKPDPHALVVSLSNSHPSKRLEEALSGIRISGRVEAGSSLKFCRVAEGKADFYPRLGSICEWDIAAGHAIVKAAGGEVTELDGGPLLYGNHEGNYRTPPFVAWGEEQLKRTVNLGGG